MYIVNIVENEPETIWVSEVWTNQEAHAASLQTEETKALIQRGMPLIAGIEQSYKIIPVGGKGLANNK